MRRSKTISIADAVKDYISEMNLGGKLGEVGVINSWEEIVGKAISTRTTNIYIRDKVLFVHLSSSVVRNELLMLREVQRKTEPKSRLGSRKRNCFKIVWLFHHHPFSPKAFNLMILRQVKLK
jgi:Dna[CI] antecedent, DciA